MSVASSTYAVSWHSLIDIGLSREIGGTAADVHSARVLIDTNVIYSHGRWEGQVFQIDRSKVRRHAQVHDDILQMDVRGRP